MEQTPVQLTVSSGRVLSELTDSIFRIGFPSIASDVITSIRQSDTLATSPNISQESHVITKVIS